MKVCSLFIFITFYCIYRYTSIKIKPDLKKNIFAKNSFDRFCVVTKFVLPSIKGLKFSKLNYDSTCAYLDEKNGCDAQAKKHTLDLLVYCKKSEPYVDYYKKQIKSYNDTVHHIMKNEIDLILLPLPTKQKCVIITALVSGSTGLAYEGISSFLHNRRHKALHKAVKAMDSKTPNQYNKLVHLEHSMVRYGIYTAETLEKLINTVHHIHNITSPNE